MTARLAAFWAERTLRERQLIVVMLALLVLVVAAFGIVRPLATATTAAEARLAQASLEAGQVRAAADRLRAARAGAPAPLATSLPLAVSQSATAAGFTLATLDPQGDDRLGITIASAKSPALFAWLAQLARQGIFVERATLRTSADATIAAEMTLRARRQ